MTRLFLSAALALTVLFLAPRSGAGEGTGASWAISGDLTLEKAVEAALRQNPDIRKQLQEIQRTRGQIVEVRAQALPHVGVSGNFRQVDRRLVAGGSFDSSDLSPTTTTTTTSTGGVTTTSTAIPVAGGDQGGGSGPGDKSWSVTITARQVLYSGGQVRAAINIAKFTEDSSYYQLRDTVDRIIALTRVQFYEVLLTRALIGLSRVQILSGDVGAADPRCRAGKRGGTGGRGHADSPQPCRGCCCSVAVPVLCKGVIGAGWCPAKAPSAPGGQQQARGHRLPWHPWEALAAATPETRDCVPPAAEVAPGRAA